MKKIFKILLLTFQLVLFLGVLASCGNTNTDNTVDPPAENNPTDPPVTDPTPTDPTEPTVEKYISIHYYRFDHSYSNWSLWLWKENGDGAEYNFDTDEDSFGAVGTFKLSNWAGVESSRLGFIIKSKGSWDEKDIASDRYISFSGLTMDTDNTYHVYLKTADEKIYLSSSEVIMKDILTCEFADEGTVHFTTTEAITGYKIYKDTEVLVDETVTDATLDFSADITELDLSKEYSVEVTFASGGQSSKSVQITKLYKTEFFEQNYTYTGNDLGASYLTSGTTFKVWSPASKSIKLRIYSTGTPLSVNSTTGSDTPIYEYEMTKGEKGVWSYEIKQDLEGKYYTYVVTNSKFTNKEIVDPYAKSAGVNGVRGMIVDFAKTNPTGWDSVTPYAYKTTELVIYETHVSDLTSSSTWTTDEEALQYAKTFTGATITGTTYTKDNVTVTTGFDHIKELGVNAVQLLPIFDQDNDEVNLQFNWGYNPLNYNVLEGGYSTDPYNGYTRIIEFKKLVQAYNAEGINIIMDVVYNHVSAAEGSNFDVLAPYYYYRYTNGTLSNGSGCGNETASEMPMFRKFMIDSTEFLASEYKLGGFRFDLMGVHDVKTMNELSANLKTKVNANISIFGEPWTGGTSALGSNLAATQANGNQYVGYGQFNDQYRDALVKSGMKGVTEKGFVNTATKLVATDYVQIQGGIKGYTLQSSGTGINDPLKTLNYVTCHDNYTLYDRMVAAGITDVNTINKQAMLANSMVLTSQGTTLILAGEEFIRTKGGDHNSYESSYKVNELDYALKVKNVSFFNNYKKLISLKTTMSGLQLTTNTDCSKIEVVVSTDGNQISYKLTDSVNNLEYYIIHNNGYSTATLPKLNLSGYTLYLDTLNSNISLGTTTSFSAYQTVIAYKTI